MSNTNFPSSIDSNPGDPTATNTLNSPAHHTLHGFANDAIIAIENYIGATASAVASSLTYLLTNVLSIDPGHFHTQNSLSGSQYAVPIIQGTNASPGSIGTVLTSNGATSSPSFQTVNNAQLISSLTAGESITAGAAVSAGYYQSDGGVTLDTATSGATTSETSISQSMTVGSNSNRILLVMLSNSNGYTYSNVQWNGTSMTLLQTQTNSSLNTYIYYLVAPATGTHNLTATASTATISAYSIYSYYNVNQSTPISENSSSDSQSGVTVTMSATPAEAGDVIWQWFSFYKNSGTGGFATTTAPNNQQTQSAPSSSGQGDTGQAVSTATQTLTWTYSGSASNPNINYGYVGLMPYTAVSFGYVVNATASNATSYTHPATIAYRYIAFLGIAISSASAGGSITVLTQGLASNQSGLTPLADYYLSNTSGAISTTAGSNTRKVGIAYNATTLLVTNIW